MFLRSNCPTLLDRDRYWYFASFDKFVCTWQHAILVQLYFLSCGFRQWVRFRFLSHFCNYLYFVFLEISPLSLSLTPFSLLLSLSLISLSSPFSLCWPLLLHKHLFVVCASGKGSSGYRMIFKGNAHRTPNLLLWNAATRLGCIRAPRKDRVLTFLDINFSQICCFWFSMSFAYFNRSFLHIVLNRHTKMSWARSECFPNWPILNCAIDLEFPLVFCSFSFVRFLFVWKQRKVKIDPGCTQSWKPG